MLQLDKISVKQILVFSEVVNEASILQKEFIEKQYKRGAPNFGQTVAFLSELNLVDIADNHIVLKPSYEQFLKNLRESKKPREATKKYIINCIVTSKSSFAEYLNEFLSRFRLVNKQYEFAPNNVERLKYSGLRNFLIDLDLLYLDSSEMKYVSASDYSYICTELRTSCRISPNEFLKIREAKEDIGNAAELKIIEYEKEQLSKYPHLSDKIEHIAKYDVKAGYDIKSYEVATGDNQYIPKYIEVKAVSTIIRPRITNSTTRITRPISSPCFILSQPTTATCCPCKTLAVIGICFRASPPELMVTLNIFCPACATGFAAT